MSDPPRLRDLPDGESSFARDLLRGADPSRAFTAADAVRLQASVTKAAAVSSSGWFAASVVPKVFAVVLATGAGGLALRAAHKNTERPALTQSHARRAPVIAAIPASEPARVEPAAPPVEPAPAVEPLAVTVTDGGVSAARARVVSRARVIAPQAPVVAVAEEPPAPPAEPTLADELRVIEEARASLRSDPARAAHTLAEASRAMPRGQLRDERDALLIEALAHAGRWDEARTRAEELERRAPQSPQSARVRALLRNAP
jgi:hypothetical protein